MPEKCPKSAIFHPLAWIPVFQARVSGPRFRPVFQARVSGPCFRPAFQARKLGHCSALQVKPEIRLEHIWGPTSLHKSFKTSQYRTQIWHLEAQSAYLILAFTDVASWDASLSSTSQVMHSLRRPQHRVYREKRIRMGTSYTGRYSQQEYQKGKACNVQQDNWRI